MPAAYERIGQGYATTRRPDPRIEERILQGLGRARTVVNVGAGAGSYEPSDRHVIAVEPAAAMLAQRARGSAPAVRAVAEALPFRDRAFDAALAVCTVHHWQDLSAGLAELRRVASRQVILMCEPALARKFWLVAEYFPEVSKLPSERRAPSLSYLARHLAVRRVIPVPVPADCLDGFTGAFWRRPEAYLDPAVQAGMSSLAQLRPNTMTRGAARLRDDLESGAWDERHGHLRQQPEYDIGYRLVLAG
jgi:SAM-dependent methyltransferase